MLTCLERGNGALRVRRPRGADVDDIDVGAHDGRALTGLSFEPTELIGGNG